MTLHQHLMGRFQKANDRQNLLHNINAVLVVLNHLGNFGKMALGFFEIGQRFFLGSIHLLLPLPRV